MKYQFVYLNVVTVCLNELDSVCLNGRAGQGKPSGGSLKYLFVYLKVRIFKCSYRIYIYICVAAHVSPPRKQERSRQDLSIHVSMLEIYMEPLDVWRSL